MINDTAAAIIAAQAKELEHLRAQRDQLQRDCTRFEAEARAAREEMRRLRAATFDRKEWLDRFFSRNRELMAALAKAEREEREAKPAPEQPAAITPPAERGDIEPETVADLLALGRPVVGLHVTVPSFMHSDRTVPRVVKDIVKLHDGTRCAVVRDDFGELLHKPENVRLAKPTPEEKTAHVARWMHVRVDAWQLVSTRGLLATMTVNHSETDPFRAFIGTDRVDGRTAIACAGWAEDYLRRSGMLPTGPIDRSALETP